MNGDVVAAKKILDTNYTCVICYKGAVLTSNKEYNEAIFDFFKSDFDFSMFSLAISVIDIKVSSLIIKMNIKNVFAYKINSNALELLKKYDVTAYYNDIIDEDLDNEIINMDIEQIINEF